jgi:uncharacterized membrane protein
VRRRKKKIRRFKSDARERRTPPLRLRKPPPPPEGVRGFLLLYARALRRDLVAGMLVWVPLIVTIWVIWWLITYIGFSANTTIEWGVTQLTTVGQRISVLGFLANLQYEPWVGFLLALLLFLTTGFIARYFVGRAIIDTAERIVTAIPLISRVYTAAKQIRDTFVNREGNVFQRVVMLEYPRVGVYVIGFVTSERQGIVQEVTEADLTAVFVPTTPNPTSGFLLYVPSDQLTTLPVTVEDAMKMTISGGAFTPEQLIPLDEDGMPLVDPNPPAET